MRAPYVLDVCVRALEHRDEDRQVIERVSERHHCLIKITSGPIRVGALIAGTRCVPAGLPWIRLSLPLPWQCLITSNPPETFFFLLLTIAQTWRGGKGEQGRDGTAFCLGYVSLSFSLEGDLNG